MERLYIDCTGGLSEVERTASGNMVKERTNLEKDGNGYLVRRSDPIDYNANLNSVLSTFTSITKISDMVYSGYMPANTTSWFLVFGKVGSINRLSIVTGNKTAYLNTLLTSYLSSLGITSLSDNLRFFISSDRILVCDGENTNFYVKINQDLDIVVSTLGLPSPNKMLSVVNSSNISTLATVSTGISVERGQILKLAYTYITKEGSESNPSPMLIYDENQLQYKDQTKDIGFDYFLESLTVEGFELPPNLGSETIESIDAFRLYMAESKYSEDVQGFNNFNMIKEFKAVSPDVNKGYSFTASSPKTSTEISYGNDISPASSDISEIGGVIGLFGLKSDLRKKFPYSFDKYYRINIPNPNTVNYINRPFMIYLNSGYSLFNGSSKFADLFTEGLDKIRFYADDFITPLKCMFSFIREEEDNTNVIQDPSASSNTSWIALDSNGWVYDTEWGIMPSASNNTVLQYALGGGFTATSDTYSFGIQLSNIVTAGRIKFRLNPVSIGSAIESAYFDLEEGIQEITYTFTGVVPSTSYYLEIECTAQSEIKDIMYSTLYSNKPSEKVLVYLEIPEILVSSTNVIYMCAEGEGVTDSFAKSYRYGKPQLLLEGNIRNQDSYIFKKQKIRNSGVQVITDCFLGGDVNYDTSEERLPNLVSENYNAIKEKDGDINIYNNSINWEYIYNTKITHSGNKDSYAKIMNANSKFGVKDFVWSDSSTPVFSVIGYHHLDVLLGLSTDTRYVIWQSGNVSTADGFYLYYVKDSSDPSNITIRMRVYNSSTSDAYYDLHKIPISEAEPMSFYYIVSIDMTPQNDNNIIKSYFYKENGRMVEGNSHDNVIDVNLYNECDWGANGGRNMYSMIGQTFEQMGLLYSVFVDNIDKAYGLLPSIPYFNIEQIGWLESHPDSEITNDVSCNTSTNEIKILRTNLSYIFNDYNVDYRKYNFIYIHFDNLPYSDNNKFYEVSNFSYDGSDSVLTLSEKLTVNVASPEKCFIRIFRPNVNIDFEELSENELVTQRNNYMQWSNVNSDTFPDTFIKRLRDIPIRGIKSPSFLRFEYQNTFIIFYKHGVDRFVFNDTLDNLATSINNVIPELSNLGLIFPDSVVETANALYWISADGVVEWSSNGIKMISELKKQNSHTKLIEINYTNGDYIGVYIPSKNQIMFIDRNNDNALVYDIDEREWMKFTKVIVNWGVTTKENNNINFLVSGNDIKKYPSTTKTTETTVLEKEYETYYALFGGYTLDMNGDNVGITAKCYNNKFTGGKLEKNYPNISSEKRYGLPAGFVGNKLSITISNADIIRPFTIDLSQRRSRR